MTRKRYLLVGVEGNQRGIEKKRSPLPGDQKQEREECVSAVLREDKLAKRLVKGIENTMQQTHLVQLVAQVNRVDVIAFKVREHNNL